MVRKLINEANKQRRSESEGGYQQESKAWYSRLLPGRGLASAGQKMKDVFTDFESFSRKDKRMWNRLQTETTEEQKNSAGEYVEWLDDLYKGFRKPKNVKKMFDHFKSLSWSTGVKLSLGKRLNLNKTQLSQVLVNINSAKEKALRRALTVYQRVQKKNPSPDFQKIIKAIESRISFVGGSFNSKIKRLRK